MNFEASRIEYINSANRIAGTNENFTYALTMAPNETYDKVCVLFANIPVSYYLVKDGSNTFQLKELSTTVTITVPPGNYSVNSFITVVNTLLNANSPNSWSYTMSINNSFTNVSNGKINYSVSGNSGQPILIFTTALYDQFGFDAHSTNIFVSNNLISLNVVDFIPETTMYIYSDIIETKDNNTYNVLQEVYNQNTANFSNIVYQCTSVQGYSKPVNKRKTNAFSIILLDENEAPISLNGQPFFLTLLFYKTSDVYDIIKKFIKYNLLSEG